VVCVHKNDFSHLSQKRDHINANDCARGRSPAATAAAAVTLMLMLMMLLLLLMLMLMLLLNGQRRRCRR
jgi:hypothetical protein